jgi:tetratricopeptide (TPR) repeat protein
MRLVVLNCLALLILSAPCLATTRGPPPSIAGSGETVYTCSDFSDWPAGCRSVLTSDEGKAFQWLVCGAGIAPGPTCHLAPRAAPAAAQPSSPQQPSQAEPAEPAKQGWFDWLRGRDACNTEGASPDQKLKSCTARLEKNPNDVIGLSQRAVAYMKMHDYDHVIADCSRVIELEPKHAQCFHNRCIAKTEKADLDGALADCTSAIDIEWQTAGDTYYVRGVVYERKGDRASAVENYKNAVTTRARMTPQAKEALTRLGEELPSGY